MDHALDFLLRHGYSVLFVWVLLEQVGLPIPSVPILLAAGTLAGRGRMNLALCIILPVLGAFASDLVWYEVGRRRGGKVLQWICRISLEPDSCVRRTEEIYERHGSRTLVAAKFIPGLNTAAPPLAGVFRMRPGRFVLFDLLGASAWALTFTLLGYVFSGELEVIAKVALRLGISILFLLLGAPMGYIFWKYWQRQKFIRRLRIARITPEELKRKMDSGEQIQVIDLRHSLDFEANPHTIPGALRLEPQEIEKHEMRIARDRDVILYCT